MVDRFCGEGRGRRESGAAERRYCDLWKVENLMGVLVLTYMYCIINWHLDMMDIKRGGI